MLAQRALTCHSSTIWRSLTLLSHFSRGRPLARAWLFDGLFIVGLLGAALNGALAQSMAPPPFIAQSDNASKPDDIGGKMLELQGVEQTMGAAAEQRERLAREIALIRTDRAKMNEALLDATMKIDAADIRMNEVLARLDNLSRSEEAIKRSLEGRRGIIAQILGVLQRMGRRAPPALLASPDDMLEAIRTSMMLGAVLPELRAETEALAGDLRELKRVRVAIASEKETLGREHAALEGERTRLGALIDARQRTLGEKETALESEQKRAAELAKQATSLKDLIARMETEIAGARRAAEEARQAEEARKLLAQRESQEQQAKIASSPFKDPARLAPAVAFAQTKGRLPMPANGQILRLFGASDGFGGFEKGLTLSLKPKTIVVSPTDGWVVFAAPYRSYGQLLILNAGDGYYVVLAGMERISVAVGQFVLAGEPVAVMSDDASKTSAAVAIGASQPVLYVEFRKDGAPVDPTPWWAKPDMKKVRG